MGDGCKLTYGSCMEWTSGWPTAWQGWGFVPEGGTFSSAGCLGVELNSSRGVHGLSHLTSGSLSPDRWHADGVEDMYVTEVVVEPSSNAGDDEGAGGSEWTWLGFIPEVDEISCTGGWIAWWLDELIGESPKDCCNAESEDWMPWSDGRLRGVWGVWGNGGSLTGSLETPSEPEKKIEKDA